MNRKTIWIATIAVIALIAVYFFGIRNRSGGPTERPSNPATCDCDSVVLTLSLTNAVQGTNRLVTATVTVKCAGQPWKAVPVTITFPSPAQTTNPQQSQSRVGTNQAGVATANRTYTGPYNPTGEPVTAKVQCDGGPGNKEVTESIP